MKKMKAYGARIGILTRYEGGGHFIEEMTPTLTTNNSGDNQMSVVIDDECDTPGEPSGRQQSEDN